MPVYPVRNPATYGRDDINKILIPYRKDRVKAPVFSNRVYSKERRGDLKRFLILF
jgi:hypothetical protein